MRISRKLQVRIEDVYVDFECQHDGCPHLLISFFRFFIHEKIGIEIEIFFFIADFQIALLGSVVLYNLLEFPLTFC